MLTAGERGGGAAEEGGEVLASKRQLSMRVLTGWGGEGWGGTLTYSFTFPNHHPQI